MSICFDVKDFKSQTQDYFCIGMQISSYLFCLRLSKSFSLVLSNILLLLSFHHLKHKLGYIAAVAPSIWQEVLCSIPGCVSPLLGQNNSEFVKVIPHILSKEGKRSSFNTLGVEYW